MPIEGNLLRPFCVFVMVEPSESLIKLRLHNLSLACAWERERDGPERHPYRIVKLKPFHGACTRFLQPHH